MSKNASILFLLLLAFGTQQLYAQTQNLVTNPGFELFNNCPSGRAEIYTALGYNDFFTVLDWVNPTNTSPDYFNRCGTDSSVRLPYLTQDGFHEPRSGNACAGFTGFSGYPEEDTTDYWAEYVETQLAYPLVAGHSYYVSFYVCLTYHGRQFYNIISVDQVGARLTNSRIDTTSTGPMFYMTGTPDIVSPPGVFITDTANWTLISGVYVANGGEQWLTIGRFYTSVINYIMVHPSGYPPDGHDDAFYLLLDDVCVIDMQESIGSDTAIYTPQFPITIGQGKPAGKYLWYNGDSSLQTDVPGPGAYVRQRWTECGYYTDTFTVAEMPVESCLWLPTAFTPNNDGDNDLFGPGNNYCQPDFKDFSFIIYNRWGQVVFQTTDAGEKWNGTYNGHVAETGTYFYILRYSYNGPFSRLNQQVTTIPKVIRGDVTLIR